LYLYNIEYQNYAFNDATLNVTDYIYFFGCTNNKTNYARSTGLATPAQILPCKGHRVTCPSAREKSWV